MCGDDARPPKFREEAGRRIGNKFALMEKEWQRVLFFCGVADGKSSLELASCGKRILKKHALVLAGVNLGINRALWQKKWFTANVLVALVHMNHH